LLLVVVGALEKNVALGVSVFWLGGDLWNFFGTVG